MKCQSQRCKSKALVGLTLCETHLAKELLLEKIDKSKLRCKVPGCIKPVSGLELCTKHYQTLKLDAPMSLIMKDMTVDSISIVTRRPRCNEKGCRNLSSTESGKCIKHSGIAGSEGGKVCAIEGCQDSIKKNSCLCFKHHMRFANLCDKVDYPYIENYVELIREDDKFIKCSVENCDKDKSVDREYCNTHYLKHLEGFTDFEMYRKMDVFDALENRGIEIPDHLRG